MKQRYENFDYLRGLSILAVVFIHVTAPMAIAEETGGLIFNQVTRFGVPVFVFLSGWGLTVAESYEKSDGYLNFLKKRLGKLLPAYVVWNVIYWVFALLVEESSLTVFEFFRGLILGTNYPHLYFVPLIVLFYILYPLLRKIGEQDWGLGLSFLVTLGSLSFHPGLVEGLTQNQNPLNWLFYFVFGIWVAKHYERMELKLHAYWVLAGLVAATFFVVLEPMLFEDELLLTQTRPSVLFYSVLLILLTIVWPNGLKPFDKLLLSLSDASYEIYLSHYLFIRVYRLLFPGLSFFILFLLVVGTSLVLFKFQKKIVR